MDHDTRIHSDTRTHRARPAAATCLAILALGLAACGGQDERTEPSVRLGTRLIAPLMADDGSVLPADPQAVPADPGAQTRHRQYAAHEQAEQLGQVLPGGVVELTVDCCGHEARERAVQIAWGLQAAQDLPDHAPVFVRGADLRTAALVADDLADAGLTRVFLVTR